MKKKRNTNKQPEQPATKAAGRSWKMNIYVLFIILFIISFVYFFFFQNYLFFFQENITLFIFSNEYLQPFIAKPGGLLEYAGTFLTQGYFSNIYASILLSVIFVLTALAYLRLNKNLSPDGSYSIPLILIPSCLLMLLQSNINWLVHHDLGLLMSLLYFIFTVRSDRKINRMAAIALFPVFYYFTGGYAWVFLFMYLLYAVFYEKWIYPATFLIVAVLTLIVSKELLFLQPMDQLLSNHLPSPAYFNHKIFLFISAAVFISYPLLIKASYLIKTDNFLPDRLKKVNRDLIRLLSVSAILLITLVLLFTIQYSPDSAKMFRIEKYLFEREFDKLIRYQEKHRLSNMAAQYYYNLALSEKGLLCDRMFFGPQDFGTSTVLIPWNIQVNFNNIYRGVYFYYSLGLVNEAHRWAFESMVLQGPRPENLKMLIKTDLINGHFRVSEKYIRLLKKTLHYRKWALNYERMLTEPSLVKADPELKEKIRLQPKTDFPIRIKNPQSNVLLVLQSNPENEKAYEYKIAWYLLEKNVGGVVNDIKQMKSLGYSRIPRHIEEAALAFAANIGPLLDLGGLTISQEVQDKYSQYETIMNIYGNQTAEGKEQLRKAGERTYWYYLDFK